MSNTIEIAIGLYCRAMHPAVIGRKVASSAIDICHVSLNQEAHSMLARIGGSLYLRAARSPACGWLVRTAIVLVSRGASSPCGAAGTMVPVR